MSPLASHSFSLCNQTSRDSQRRSSNRFQLLADMPENDVSDATAAAVSSKKRTSRNATRSHARRKYSKRASLGARENVYEAIEIAHSGVRLHNQHLAYWNMHNRSGPLILESNEDGEVWQEYVTSYDPHLEIELPGDLTLDNLPRPVPPFSVKVKTKSAKREKNVAPDDDDWDLVSNASDESFCMV